MDPSLILEGGCLCKAVRYSAEGPPRFAIRCFCRDCQHVSGGGHLPQVAVARPGFDASGPVSVHRRVSDGGADQEIGFCSRCGSPVYRSTTLAPELVFLTAGSLDEPARIPEPKPVHAQTKLPWDESAA